MITMSSRTSRFTRIAAKELKETLRDRRTLITLFLMPILLYPLLSLIMNRLLLTSGARTQTTLFRIGVASQEDAQILLDVINTGRIASKSDLLQPLKILWSNRNPPTAIDSDLNSPTPVTNDMGSAISDEKLPSSESLQTNEIANLGFRILLVEDGDLGKALKDDQIDISVRSQLAKATPKIDYTPIRLDIEFRESDSISENAVVELRKIFSFVNEAAALRQRVMLGIPDAVPVTMIAAPTKQATANRSAFAGIIPLILILMTITGGVYPAIDLTAGERERGTLEALIASPISRLQLVASKYVAVVCVAILTAFINLFAMSITLKVTGVGDLLMGANGIDAWMLLRTIPLLVMFAIFFSSILVALCSFARSFKEAQAYLIPIMLLSLGPGIISLMPSVKLTASLAVLPQVNLILLARDTLSRADTPLYIVVTTILTTFFYTIAALAIASKGFGDQIAVAGDDFRWSDLLKRPERVSDYPTIGQLSVFLSVFFPIYFITTSLLGSAGTLSLGSRAWINALALVGLFLLLPLAFSLLIRNRLASTYRLSLGKLPLVSVATAIVLAATLWMFAFEIIRFSDLLGIKTLSDEVLEKTKQLREEFLSLPWWVVMLTMALAPAIAEEFFFRGFVLSSLSSNLSKHRAVIVSSILFGVFHVVYGSLLSIERFLPSTMLGLFLGYLAIYSRSLWPGVVLHAGHNGLLFSLPYIDTTLKSLGFDRESGRLPIVWLIVGIAATAASMLIFVKVSKHRYAQAAVQRNIESVENQHEFERETPALREGN